MNKHNHHRRTRRVFIFRPLQASHMEFLSSWAQGEEDSPVFWRDGIYHAFNRHFEQIWHAAHVRSWVMTRKGKPVFCMTVLEQLRADRRSMEGGDHLLYLLAAPAVRKSLGLLTRAWLAASLHTFQRWGLKTIETHADVDDAELNAALLATGYRLVGQDEHGGRVINVYICRWKDLQAGL